MHPLLLTTIPWVALSCCTQPSFHATANLKQLQGCNSVLTGLEAGKHFLFSFFLFWQDASIPLAMGLGAAEGSCKWSRAQGRKALGCDRVISLTGFFCPPNICAVTHLWKICEWVSLDLSLSQMGLYTAHITKPSDTV